MDFRKPVADPRNPCYAPLQPASAFLNDLASEAQVPPRSRDQYLISFLARLLYPPQSSHQDFMGWPFKHPENSFTDELLSQSQGSRTTSSSSTLSQDNSNHRTFSTRASPTNVIPVKRSISLLNKPAFQDLLMRSDSMSSGLTDFSDLKGPSKRMRSEPSLNQSSFEVTKADRLVDLLSARFVDSSVPDEPGLNQTFFFDASTSLGNGLHGVEDVEGFGPLLSHLDRLLPGIRMKERLLALENLDHQIIADVLAGGGHLTSQTLHLFRHTEIHRLDLSPSLVEEDGLNIGRREILHELKTPDSFQKLTDLLLDGTPIQNFDLVCIHHLPNLRSLNLCDTNIGNEAVFHIVALRSRLRELFLGGNPLIDDDAIPAIILLDRLTRLSLSGTSVTILSLRRLALAVHEQQRTLEVDVPVECENYIEDLPDRYSLDPKPPLITDPTVCDHLSHAALKRNLSEHAVYNHEIETTGSKAQLVQRLQRLLEARRADLLVRDMVWSGKPVDDANDELLPEDDDDDSSVF